MRLVLLLGLGALLPAQDFDVLIRGARVADGTGNASWIGDIGIRDHKIAAMGRLADRTAKQVIDAAGLVAAPGFIDIHNHSDYTILTDGNAEGMVRQGVTSMILGEGGSAAPVGGKQDGNPDRADWTDFKGYFVRLMRQGVSTNIGTYVGSSQIWTYVRGEKAGPPAADELTQMQTLVRQAMQQGALGVASSLSGPPGSWIDTATLIAMCKVAGEYGGIYSTHMRTEGLGVFESVAEALQIGRKAGVPVDIIHLKLADHQLWGQMPELVATIAQARAGGQEVTANVYPYRAGQNNLATIIPPWAHEGGREALLKRLRDPALRPRLQNEIEHGIPGSNWYNHYTATGSWEGMLLVSLSNPAYKKFEGRRMNEVIQTLGGKPIDVLFKVLEDNGGSVPAIYFHHDENDMRYALRQPFVSIGSDGSAFKTEGPLSRGNPHPRSYGTFARVLGRYVRDEKVLTLEDAVRKMTSANASKIHIYDRGLLRAGMWADVTIFDPGKILDLATWEKPHQYAAGVEYVFVNGTLVLSKGQHTGARPGVILCGPGNPACAPPSKASPPEREVAEWVIRQGGGVMLSGSADFIHDLSLLPPGVVTITGVDLVGTIIEPTELSRLSGLGELRQLLLPGPIFNPGAGSSLDANDELSSLANLQKLEKLSFSLHFLTNINIKDKGLDYLKGLTGLRELRLAQTEVAGPSLAPFVNLRYLDLNYVPFKDAGMQYLRGMKHLEHLLLRDTFVTDEGLKNLEGLTGLTVLDLYGTKISDAGLPSLRRLTKLQELNILGANLTDDGLDALADMRDLRDLNLYRTNITNAGLEKLKNFRNLTALDLRYTRVTRGGVDAFRTALPHCTIEFQDAGAPVSDAGLQGSRPAGMDDGAIAAWVEKLGGKATIRDGKLREIVLARTPITDSQLQYFTPLAALQSLDLRTTEIGDLGAAYLGKLTGLVTLNLTQTMISDKGLTKLAGLTKLRRLVLNNSLVQGPGLAALASSPELEELELAGTQLSDEGLHYVAAHPSLRALRLDYTNITDAGLSSLEPLTNLRRLDLTAVDVGDKGLEALGKLSSLTELLLSYDRLTDKGLASLTALTQLGHLEVARTRVTDAGMASLAKLSTLTSLNLDYTAVSDKGIATLQQALPALTELHLDSAELTDAGAETVRKWTGLKYLNLYHTLVTAKEFEELKKTLPECRIIYDQDSALPNRRHS